MTNDLLDLLGPRNRRSVATVLAYLIALSALLMATLLAQVAGNFQGRGSAEIAASAGAPLIGMALTQYAPSQERLRIAIASAGHYCFALVVFILLLVVDLIAQKAPEVSLARAMEISDKTWIAGPIIGALALVCLIKLVTNGTEAFTRARGAALGDACWLDIAAASKLFPADGEVVIGEAYRPDQERSGHQAFDPGNKETWGSGGRGHC